MELSCDNWEKVEYLTVKEKDLLNNLCGKRFVIEAKFE